MLTVGEPAPWFTARCTVNPTYQFHTLAGHYVVLCFFGSAGNPQSNRLISTLEQHHDRFDSENFCFFGVSADPDDEHTGRAQQKPTRWAAHRVAAFDPPYAGRRADP